MTFSKWGYIFLGLGNEDPQTDRAEMNTGGLTTTVVAVPERSAAVPVAVELVEQGAQSIELCGAFGPKWVAEVLDATGGRVPVGGVNYGMESVHALTKMFPPGS